MIDVHDEAGVARVLLIADDPLPRQQYAHELESSGYVVAQATSYADTLLRPMVDPDVIVLCNLAVLAHPGQSGQVVRIPDGTSPAAVVREVHRRIALRATLGALVARAA
jgi:DNA-binding NarL/FixJ family response regulator